MTDNKPERKLLIIKNQVGELSRIEFFLKELGTEWKLSSSLILSVNLVIEETVTNIISYGYDDNKFHDIELYFEKTGEELKLEICDDGHEFDPTLRDEPDIMLELDERPVGGLGIFLVRKLMDHVTYKRSGNKNHLFLTKRTIS
jgi:serine/threonine-protein kinase RsbW